MIYQLCRNTTELFFNSLTQRYHSEKVKNKEKSFSGLMRAHNRQNSPEIGLSGYRKWMDGWMDYNGLYLIRIGLNWSVFNWTWIELPFFFTEKRPVMTFILKWRFMNKLKWIELNWSLDTLHDKTYFIKKFVNLISNCFKWNELKLSSWMNTVESYFYYVVSMLSFFLFIIYHA